MISAKIFADGDKVCALIGDNLQEGIAGFGNKISEALADRKDPERLVTLMLQERMQLVAVQIGVGQTQDEGDVQRALPRKSGAEKKHGAGEARRGPGAKANIPDFPDKEFIGVFVKHLYPMGKFCPGCGAKVLMMENKPRKYKCPNCKKVGSFFEVSVFSGSKMPLSAWALVMQMVNQDTFLSAGKVQERLKIAYPAAKIMLEKIAKIRSTSPLFFGEIVKMMDDRNPALMRALPEKESIQEIDPPPEKIPDVVEQMERNRF